MFQDVILTLAIVDVVTNQEIETALDEALASPAARNGMRLLWDSRRSQTPLSSDDMAWRFELLHALGRRGVFDRGALLLRPEQRQFLQLWQMQRDRVRMTLEASVFLDEAEAVAWLRR